MVLDFFTQLLCLDSMSGPQDSSVVYDFAYSVAFRYQECSSEKTQRCTPDVLKSKILSDFW